MAQSNRHLGFLKRCIAGMIEVSNPFTNNGNIHATFQIKKPSLHLVLPFLSGFDDQADEQSYQPIEKFTEIENGSS